MWHHIHEPILEQASSAGDEPTRAKANSFKMAGVETLNPSVLQCFNTGRDRARKYVHTYYITDPFRVDCSEKKFL